MVMVFSAISLTPVSRLRPSPPRLFYNASPDRCQHANEEREGSRSNSLEGVDHLPGWPSEEARQNYIRFPELDGHLDEAIDENGVRS